MNEREERVGRIQAGRAERGECDCERPCEPCAPEGARLEACDPCDVKTDKIRPIKIEQLNHGYVVTVGCQQFAIEKPETITSKLAEYFNNPAETEKKWFSGKLL